MKTGIIVLVVTALVMAACKAGFSGRIDKPSAATKAVEEMERALS